MSKTADPKIAKNQDVSVAHAPGKVKPTVPSGVASALLTYPSVGVQPEPYDEAEAKMKQVADEIRARWPLVQGLAMVQRVGHLNVGEFTVLIAVSAGHRDQGVFEAARYGIDPADYPEAERYLLAQVLQSIMPAYYH